MFGNHKTLRDRFSDAKEPEKPGSLFYSVLIIPFIPAKGSDHPVELIEFQYPLVQGGKGTGNMVKKNHAMYSSGTVEDLLFWRRDLEQILATRKITSEVGMFETDNFLIGEEPLLTFRELRRKICSDVPASSIDDEPEGETHRAFPSVLNLFIKS